MTDEARLHSLLDLVEQARQEGDSATEQKAIAAYKRESQSYDMKNTGVTGADISTDSWSNKALRAGKYLTRKIGMYGRDAAVGGMQGPAFLADVASLPVNAVPWAYDKLTGKEAHPLMPLSQGVGKIDTALANPSIEPDSAGERVGRDIRRSIAGTLTTAGIGGAAGIPFLSANPVLQTVSATTGAGASGATREMGGGKVAQTIAGLLGGMAPGAAKYGLERLIGEPNAAGQTLLNKNVDLTPGQQQAGGAYSQIEDASAHLPLIGSQFQKAKDQAQQQAKEAFILEAQAPGAKVPATGDLHQTLENVGKTFEPAYDAVSGFPLVLSKGKPVIVNQGENVPLSTAFKQAVSDRGIDATQATRDQAASWLDNLLTRPVRNSEDLISMRSEIRSRINSLAKDTSSEVLARREIYQKAADQVTKTLESQLPPDLMQNLRAVDAQYAKYKTAVDAMAKAGDRPGGFTWAEASQAAKSSAQGALGKDAYARGEGFMRDIPSAAREAFATRPQTGASLTAQAAAYPSLLLTAPLSLTKTGRAFAAGNRLNPMNLSPSSNAAVLANILANGGAQ